ncbi:MAG: membrane protein insertion efficiency factor YidD [Bdellovibrionales bacterium]|nr:membrane protein insertion efficiency factor YidD [Bdellovibrionales bacterium]
MRKAKKAESQAHSPFRQVGELLLDLVFGIYRLIISPTIHLLAGAQSGCRYPVSCSQYSKEAFRAHGFSKGLLLSAKRLSTCHPWGKNYG